LFGVPADNNDPAFLICHGHVMEVLTYIQYQRKLRDTLKRCKLNPSNYSSHSFRRGGASWAFQPISLNVKHLQ
jgi:hypothetical protein